MRVRLAYPVWAPSIAGGLALLLLLRAAEIPPVLYLGVFAVLAALAEWMAFPLIQGGDQTFDGLVLLPGIVLLGPIPAAVAAVFGAAAGTGLLRRRSLQVTAFTAGMRVVSVLLAGLAWSLILQGRPELGRPLLPVESGRLLPAVVGTLLVYALAGTLQVNAYVAAARQRAFWSVLGDNAPWQVPGAVVAGAFGFAVALLPTTVLLQEANEALIPLSLIPLLIGSLAGLLYVSRRQTAVEASHLHAALASLLRTPELDALLGRFADTVERLSLPDILGIFLRDPDGSYQVTLIRGISPDAIRPLLTDFDKGLIGWAIARRRPATTPDYAKDPRRRPQAEALSGPGRLRSVMILPLLVGDEVLGVLVLSKPFPGYFTASQERLIATIAAQAAMAIKNARLYEASRRALARGQALQQLAQVAAAGADLDTMQQAVVDIAVATLGAHRGVLATFDEERRVLIGTAFHNAWPEEEAAWRYDGTEGHRAVSARAFDTLEPVAVAGGNAPPGAPADSGPPPTSPDPLPAGPGPLPTSPDPLPAGPGPLPAGPGPLLTGLPPAGSGAVLAVPMSVQGRAIGTLEVHHLGPHRWTTEEIDLLQALANEGAVAIQHVRLSRATSRQLQQMKALEAISERINSQRDLDSIIDLIADSAREVLGADHCGIYLNREGGQPAKEFARGLPREFVRAAVQGLQVGTSSSALAMRAREPVIVTDVLADPRGEAIREAAAKLGIRTNASFPLQYGDQVIGVLSLYHHAVHPYDPDEISLGAAFANQAAMAVQNTWLLKEAEHTADQLKLLNRIITRMTMSHRPEDLYENLVEDLHTTLNYPFVIVLLTEDGGLRVMAQRGYRHLRKAFALTEGVIGRTARTGQAVLVEDVSQDPDYIIEDRAATQEACVPIIQDGRVIGVLNVEVIIPTLTQADLSLLTTLAGEITAAMRNASLFAEVQQARDELQALYDSARTVSTSLELPTVLEALVSVTCHRFGYDHGAILLVDPEAGDLVIRAAYRDPAAVGRRIALGRGAEGRAAQGAQPVLIPDVTWDPLEASAELRSGSKLAIPLLREERVIGVFTVDVSRPGALGERDKRVLTTLAGYAAMAIENARLYEETRHLASTDGLTGVTNHRAFREALEEEVRRSRRYGLPLSLIMIEIDRFKRYNDTYGHLRGDDVLRLVARILEREHRKKVDVIARYGGDEFMVLLPHTVKADAAEAAERIRRAVEATPFIVGDEVTSVTLSLGVACFPEDGETADAFLDAADRRVYAAKQAGGNAVRVATAS